VDFTIKLKPDGTAETNAAADAVARVRTELEKTQAIKGKVTVKPDKAVKAPSTSADEKKAITEQRAREKAEAKRVVDDEKKLAQIKKQQDRESAAMARATAQANRDLDKYAKEEAKAAEKAALAKIDPNTALSKIDRAKKRVSDKKEKADDQARAEKIDPSSKELTKTQKAVKAKFTDPLKLGIAGAAVAVGASLTGLVYKFAPLAMGYMGMARLSMISQQASFNMRRLFVGANPKPLLDALQRTSQLIDPRTFTGKTLGEFFVRSANGIFNFLSKAEPYVRLFFKGMLYGALQAEIAWLKLRIAIQPALNLLPSGIGLMTAFGAGALAVKASFGLLGVGVALGAVKAGAALLTFGRAALAATGPLLPFIAAVVAWKEAWEQAIELKKQWDENSATQIGNKLKADLGITSKEEADDAMAKRQGILTGDDYDKRFKLGKYAEKKPVDVPIPKDAGKQAAPAGANVGKQLGLGMLQGMKDTEAKVAAGGRDLVLAAEGGAKAAAEIKSPARRWRREIGRNLGEGAALGLEDSADRMDEAARAIIPGAPGIGVAGGRGSSLSIGQLGPFYGMPAGGEQQVRRWVFDALDDAAERMGMLASTT
jgi:hypothetical protein